MFSSQVNRRNARERGLGSASRRSRFETFEARRVLHGAAWPTLVAAEGEGAPVPDFALVDTNATSPTYEQSVSPRDYLQQVSAWYFGHSS